VIKGKRRNIGKRNRRIRKEEAKKVSEVLGELNEQNARSIDRSKLIIKFSVKWSTFFFSF
jgi:hypothetical protein